jgi:integrase
MHAVLRKALTDAVRDGLLTRNPVLVVQPPRVTSTKVVPLTPDEARRLLAAGETSRLRALWLVLLGLGLRRGEALALRWDDIDLDHKTLSVRRSLQRLRGEIDPVTRLHCTHLVEAATKTTGSVRVLALPAALATALTDHRTAQIAERLAAPVWFDSDLVFTTTIGTPLEPRNVSRDWQALLGRASIERSLRIHDLRHSAASFLLMRGTDMRLVMDVLGHTRMSTTSDLYTHVLDEVKRQAAIAMDGLLSDLRRP